MKITTQLDYEVILANRACPVYFALHFEAPVIGAKARPKPAAFCLVLDRSGSMAGPPLTKAKQAAMLAVRNLRLEDNFALVIFDHEAQVLIPFQPALKKAEFMRSIEGIESRGNTNLTGGWMLGRDEVKQAPAEASRRLLLLSDGLLNSGIIEPAAVRQVVMAGLELDRVRTSCLGFGANYNEDLMTTMAQVSGGQFYDADAPEKFPAIFESELEGLQKLAVQNLRVRLRRVVCFQLDVLPLPWLAGRPVVSLEGERLLEVEMAYDDLGEGEITSRTETRVMRIQATQNPAEVRQKAEVIPWVALQRAGQVIDQVTQLMDGGRVDEALVVLNQTINSLKSYGPEATVGEAVKQLEDLLGRLTSGEWSLRLRKLSKYRSHSYGRMSSSEHWSSGEPPPSFKPPRPQPPIPPAPPVDPNNPPAGGTTA